MQCETPRILIVDDDDAHVGLLSDYLEAQGFQVASVTDGHRAVAAALEDCHDLLVLDVMMPGISGIEILAEIRKKSQLPVVMLTAKGDDIDRIVGLELGADDYVAKPFLPRELVARLRAVLRRHHYSPADEHHTSYNNGLVSIDLDTREAHVGTTLLDLTASEFNILAALLKSLEHVLTKDELTRIALRRNWSSYDRSIDVHIKNLRQKLSLGEGCVHGLETVRGVGYRMVRVA